MTVKVCVIGCGVSGLVSIKACLEEGLEVTCYEQYDDIGGTWYYSEEIRPNQGGSVYFRLNTNTSKEMTRFSDFPMPDQYPPFLRHEMLLEYLRNYAKEFDLLKHVKFNTQVKNVTPADDYDVTGRWIVVTCTKSSDEPVRQTFDAVLVASGYFKKEFRPHIPGQETFKGSITHSKTYRRSENFKGKTVVVVGNSFSAGDVVMDVAYTAAKVHLAIGNGTWAHGYFKRNNEPLDFISRSFFSLSPKNLNKLLRQQANDNIDHYKTGLAGTREPLNQAFMVVDNLSKLIGSGIVVVQGFLERLNESSAEFTGGSKETIDDVILATGFRPEYSFLDNSIVADKFENMRLYKMMWPCDLEHPTLALIGCMATTSSLLPLMELQARWAALVISGKRHLPSKPDMVKDVQHFKEAMRQQYGTAKLFAAAIPYQDEIAELIGCKPNFWHYAFTDWKVAKALKYGPVFPAQYRMQGPHSIPEARDHFLKAYDRTMDSVLHREVSPPSKRDGHVTVTLAALVGFVFAAAVVRYTLK